MRITIQQTLCYAFTFLFVFFSSSSIAQATAYHWQGPYAGAFLGGGFGNNHLSTNTGSVTDTSYFLSQADINAVNNAGSSTSNKGTMIAGIEAGHDWVAKQLVYGIVMDFSALPLSSTSSTTNSTYPDSTDVYSVSTSMQTNWLFTLRARLGYQTLLQQTPALFYLTGGAALTQLKVNNHFNDNTDLSGFGTSNTARNQIGWTAGAGVEVAAVSHFTVDLEYLYVQVPSVKTAGFISNTEEGFGIPQQSMNNLFSTTADFHANIFKVAFNYRFDE